METGISHTPKEHVYLTINLVIIYWILILVPKVKVTIYIFSFSVDIDPKQMLYSGFHQSFYPRVKSFAKLTWKALRTAHDCVFDTVVFTVIPDLTSRFNAVSFSQNQDSHRQDQSIEQLHPPQQVLLLTHTHTHTHTHSSQEDSCLRIKLSSVQRRGYTKSETLTRETRFVSS